MNFAEMSVEEMETRLSAIPAEAETAEDDAQTALLEEARGIKEELERRRAAEAKRIETREAVANGKGEVEHEFTKGEKTEMTVEEIRKSHEYNVAYANYIKTENDAECRALLTTQVTGGQVPVPTYVEGRIRTAWEKAGLMNLVRKTFVKGNLKVGFELSADGALIHTEGSTANSEESLTIGVTSLVPQSIKKWISVSDEALDLSGEEFLDYIYDELTYRIAKKAQEELIAKIIAKTASATSAAVGVGVTAGTPTVGIIAAALGTLSDEAVNPVIVMNKATWAQFKAAQYANSYAVDPFEGLPVYFDSTIPAYTSSGTTGSTWCIVGDFGNGAQANFPAGAEIGIKRDDLSLAERDLVKFVGRQFVAVDAVANNQFCKVTF